MYCSIRPAVCAVCNMTSRPLPNWPLFLSRDCRSLKLRFFCCCHSLECATHVSAATKPPEIIKCVRILYVNHYVGARHAPMSGRFHPIIKCVRPSQKSSWSAEKYTTFFDPLAEIISVPERNSLNTFKKEIMIKVFHGLKLPCFYPILDEQKLGICRII